jgi:hypothetical protein
MSDLRTRIAAVITDGVINGSGHGTIADAVIAELGLKHSCRECGGWGPFDE